MTRKSIFAALVAVSGFTLLAQEHQAYSPEGAWLVKGTFGARLSNLPLDGQLHVRLDKPGS